MDACELVAASQAPHGCGPSLGTYAMHRTATYQLDVAWRQTRGGSFQLTTSYLVATCRQVAAAPTPVWSSMNTERRREMSGSKVRDYCVRPPITAEQQQAGDRTIRNSHLRLRC